MILMFTRRKYQVFDDDHDDEHSDCDEDDKDNSSCDVNTYVYMSMGNILMITPV